MAECPCDQLTATVESVSDSMEKPMLDDRSYRVIRLSNALEVLLIHDAGTDKASAAMDVDVGSFSDPDDMPGMAHAIEHLLFMGTEKYPGENDYGAYLTKYGGMSNAFTAPTSTNFYFELAASSSLSSPDVTPQHDQEHLVKDGAEISAPLYGALDRFAQFFIRPNFSPDTLDRELRAVDSENKKNLQSDTWRLHQLNKSLSNPLHPYHKFSTGNYKVLHDDPIARGVQIRERFITFYESFYSANRMKLVVLGREGLDTLQKWVVLLFSDVKNKNLPQPRWDKESVFGEDELSTQVFAKPVMESRSLDLYFPYPDEDAQYESKPGRYLSHLIGHEGPGSILAYLKRKGWANSLSSGSSSICPNAAFFSIGVRLTEDGLKHYEDVVRIVFQYIALLNRHDPERWIADEMGQLAEIEFRFRQKIPASRTTSFLSGVMQKPYPRDQILSAPTLVRKFDPDGIRRGLRCLRPDNLRLTIVTQHFSGTWTHQEKWYGTEYHYEKIPSSFLRTLADTIGDGMTTIPDELHLPSRNEFIPRRLEVEIRKDTLPLLSPKLIRNESNVRTWFKKDDRFWVPKANLEICLRSPLINLTPLTAVMAALYKDLVEDSLDEFAYDAELAGLEYSIQNHGQGFDVSISGFNDKMSVLLEKVLLSMRDLKITSERFEVMKERLIRGLRNIDFQDPFRQISSYSRWLFSERGWIHFELLKELMTLSLTDVTNFFPHFLRQMHIEVLVHGNLYKEDALKLTDMVETLLNPKHLPMEQWPMRRSVVLPPASSYLYRRLLKNPDNVNHCIDYIIFIGTNIERQQRAKLLLFAQIAEEPCFDTLRTKEQLGYIVSSQVMIINTVSAFRIVVQSERDCKYLEQRIDSFLLNMSDTIESMPDSEFSAHKSGLINRRLEKLKNLQQESSRFWHHISSELFDFEIARHDVENIAPLSKSDMLAFIRTHISPTSKTRTKASIHLIANAGIQARSNESVGSTDGQVAASDQVVNRESGITIIEDVQAFKASVPLSIGAKPTQSLSAFEDSGPKL